MRKWPLFTLVILALAAACAPAIPPPPPVVLPPTLPPSSLSNPQVTPSVDPACWTEHGTLGDGAAEIYAGIHSLALSQDDTLLAGSQTSGNIRIWRMATLEEIAVLHGHTRPSTLAFSPDRLLLASGGRDGTTRLWDVTNGQELGLWSLEEREEATGLGFAPNGTDLFISTRFGKVYSWDLAQQEISLILQANTSILSMALNPDGRLLAYSTDLGDSGREEEGMAVYVYDLAANQPRATFDFFAFDLAFSPDGARIVAGGYQGIAQVWELDQGQGINALVGHTADVNAVAVSPDGAFIASGGDDQTVRLWDLQSGQLLHEFASPGGVTDILFSPDGRFLAFSTTGGDVHLWQQCQ